VSKVNPLLPKEYTDSSVQSAILYALAPYKINPRGDVINPNLKWNLSKAWKEAEVLLPKANWRRKEDDEVDELAAGYELSAYSDAEVETLNSIVAGIIAYQTMEPDSGFSIRRVEHRKGGEMALIISGYALEKIREKFPESAAEGGAAKGYKRWWNIFSWFKKKT